jgi:hypothetical protein
VGQIPTINGRRVTVQQPRANFAISTGVAMQGVMRALRVPGAVLPSARPPRGPVQVRKPQPLIEGRQ